MYKIFFKDRLIYLTNRIDIDLTDDFGSILKYANQGELLQFIANFDRDTSIGKAFIYHHNVFELLQNFRLCFKNLPAAGGLVWNAEGNRFLAIKRLGVYDLPKGKVEPDETFEAAAIREVEEECGISGVTIIKKLTSTYHTYHLREQHIFKETKWFEMSYKGTETPSPQTSENIESVFWANPSSLSDFKANTYPSIIEVLKSSDEIDLAD
ncbi:NUDIX hydrolase [Alkaliflexus imshenetskii]|uniref:NUDIX hydrolase n=1 Tax=Alkaliflexus imshenetskii TaxID=286730 RepID=UPI0004ADA807|nr:NUDIX domain-containing protein [Alkaliflexus imshenetskii]